MCMNPLLAIRTGEINPDTGKEKLKLIRPFMSSIEDVKSHYGSKLVLLPCGKCPSCLKSYSFDWSNRLMAESLYHDQKCFLTLTYDNEHLPKAKKVVSDIGEVKMFYPLVKKDLQDFFKRLRKALPGVKIRYFACGEHGESIKYFDWLGRPHYHVILFGYDFPDKKVISWNALGQALFTSKQLADIWANGNVSIGEVTAESCGYVARYSLKKRCSDENTDEFVVMSRKPGIGRQLYEDKKRSIYLSDKVYSTKFGSSKPPRYYDSLAENDSDMDVFIPFQSAKVNRQNRSDGLQYLEMIHLGVDSVEEANMRLIDEAAIRMNTLRRNI